VRCVRRVLERGWGGRAGWIVGASGTGKTTVAKLIAVEGASEYATEELDAGSLTPAKLRELKRQWAMRPLPVNGLAGWAFIVNECHKLRRDTVTALLDVLESLPDYVCCVFTYNAWRALGRQVRRGEHGVKVVTFVSVRGRDSKADVDGVATNDADGTNKGKGGYRRPWTATVFHVSQTDPVQG